MSYKPGMSAAEKLEYLKLDQTTPQTVENGAPVFEAGLETQDNVEVASSKGLVVTELSPTTPTGGTITTDGLYTIHKFTTNGTLALPNTGDIEYLMVGGGGGAASSVGGPGGGGGYLAGTATITNGSYPVVIGDGGVGKAAGSKTFGNDGTDSTFNGLTAKGGGGGGAADTNNGRDGGCGGGTGPGPGSTAGQGYAGPPRQGYNGGVSTIQWVCPGGGGAGQQGGDSSASAGGKGGDGVANDILVTGVNVYYGGGGGGGAYYSTQPLATPGQGGLGGGGNAAPGNDPGLAGTPGTDGLGGGAGGGSCGGGNIPASAGGGSGVVIVRYLTSTQYGNATKSIIKRTSAVITSNPGTVEIGYTGDTVKINPLITNGFVKTTGSNGALSVDTETYKLSDRVTTVIDTYNILAGDVTVVCNKATNFTVTLPTAVVGKIYYIINIGAGTVTVDGAGTDTISGELTQTLYQWEAIHVQCYVANKWGIN